MASMPERKQSLAVKWAVYPLSLSAMMNDKKGVRRQKSRQEEYEMARRGENIYKRGDGRWEGRYIRGRTPEGRAQYRSEERR